MMTAKVPAQVTLKELEAAFPWVRFLPPKALGEFMSVIESWRGAAEIYSTMGRRGKRCC
jgi:hypothetical protein